MANRPKRALANIGFRVLSVLFCISCTTSVSRLTLRKQLQVHALAGQPWLIFWIFWQYSRKPKIACKISADSTFVLRIKGSLSRTLDQGLSLPVVIETPSWRLAVTVSPLLLAVLQSIVLHRCRTPVSSASRNNTVLAIHQWLMWREEKNFSLVHSAQCIGKHLKEQPL